MKSKIKSNKDMLFIDLRYYDLFIILDALFFKNVVDLSEKHGFLKRVNNLLEVGPTGALLEENLKREWFYATITNRDFPVFVNNGSFEDTFLYAKDICLNRFPFGIAEILPNPDPQIPENDDKNLMELSNKLGTSKLLSCVSFIPGSESVRFFHQMQRQRRMWWRIVMFTSFYSNKIFHSCYFSFQLCLVNILCLIHVLKEFGISMLILMLNIHGDRKL